MCVQSARQRGLFVKLSAADLHLLHLLHLLHRFPGGRISASRPAGPTVNTGSKQVHFKTRWETESNKLQHRTVWQKCFLTFSLSLHLIWIVNVLIKSHDTEIQEGETGRKRCKFMEFWPNRRRAQRFSSLLLISPTAAVIRSGPPGSVLLTADWSWRGTGLYFMERNVTERRQRTRTRTRTRVSAECWLHSELHLDSNRNTLHAARPLTADVQWSYLAGWVTQIITSDPVVKPSLLVLNTLINIHSCCGS